VTGDLSIRVHDVYRVTTCRPGRGHIVAAARLQLVWVGIPSSLPFGRDVVPKSRKSIWEFPEWKWCRIGDGSMSLSWFNRLNSRNTTRISANVFYETNFNDTVRQKVMQAC